MSLILDALKRAERERKLENAPDLSAIYQEGGLNRRKYYPWFWVGGAFLAAFVVLAFAFWPKSQDDIKNKTPASPLTASAPTKRSLPKEPSPPVARKTVENSAQPPSVPTAENKPLKTPKKVQILEKPLPVSQEKTILISDPVKEPPEKSAEAEAIKSPPPKNVSAREKLGAEPVKQFVAPKRTEDRPKAAAAVVPPPQPKVTFPSIHELPEDIQSALGPLEINVHMYSPNPSERRVFINMQGYREGDTIGEGGFKLTEITPYGVVIDYGQGKAVLGVKHK